MALKIGKGNIHALKKQALALKARADNLKEKTEVIVGQVRQTVEVSAAGFGMGMIEGKFGPVTLGGIPAPLLGGAGLNLMGYMAGGKYADDMHNLGDGLLCVYSYHMGTNVGKKIGKAVASGELSADELRRMADD